MKSKEIVKVLAHCHETCINEGDCENCMIINFIVAEMFEESFANAVQSVGLIVLPESQYQN